MKKAIYVIAISLVIVLISVTYGISIWSKTAKSTNIEETRIIRDELALLKDSVSDLEQKANILNKYLHAKHLEYIEVCNLVHYKSNK